MSSNVGGNGIKTKKQTPLQHFEQLDVEILDNELNVLLLAQKTSKLLIQKLIVPIILHYRTNSYNNGTATSSDEKDIISLISMTVVKSIIYFITIGYNDIPTPAMSILGLQYNYNTIPSTNNSHGRLKFQKKVLLYIFSIILPSLEQYLRNTVLLERNANHDGNASPNNVAANSSISNTHSSSTLETIGYNRRKSMLRFLIILLDFTRVVNYVQFLVNNDESINLPPLLCLRLLSISYCRDENSVNRITNSGATRVINYIYAYRRILYSELFRCILHIFPKDGFIAMFK